MRQRVAQHLLMARMAGAGELRFNALAVKQQAVAFGLQLALFGGELRLLPLAFARLGRFDLRLDFLALPTARHDPIVYCKTRMHSLLLLVTLASAQNAPAPSMEETARLQKLVASSPRLPLRATRIELKNAPPIDYVSSAVVDRKGLVYLFQRGDQADPVMVITSDGLVKRSFAKGLYKIPHSIRIDPQGNLWTVDSQISVVHKFTLQGKKLLEINVGGIPANPRSNFCGTTDITFGPGGRLFISDGYCNARVLEYTADGKLVREWGKPGTGPGEFKLPHGITIDTENVLYVADRENGRIQRFDTNGKFLGLWDHLGKTFALTAVGKNELWIGTQPRTSPNGKDGWIMKIDRSTGKILGYVESEGTHSMNLNAAGEPIVGARPDKIFWFRAER